MSERDAMPIWLQRFEWWLWAIQGHCHAMRLYNAAWTFYQSGALHQYGGEDIAREMWEAAVLGERILHRRFDVAAGRISPEMYAASVRL